MIYGRRLTLTHKIYFITFDVIYQTQETVLISTGYRNTEKRVWIVDETLSPVFDIPLDRNEN